MDSEKLQQVRTPASAQQSPRRWRRAVVTSSVVCGMLFSGLTVLPTAFMSTSYRDVLLNRMLEKRGLTAVSKGGSGSWLTPIVFRDVKVMDESGQVKCEIESTQTSKSLMSLIFHDGDLGTFTMVRPELTLTLDEDGNLPLKSPDAGQADRNSDAQPSTESPDLAFALHDARIQITAPWRPLSIVDVAGLDVSGSVFTEDNARWLRLDPVQVFDHESLSDLHTEQNLALIAPVLAQTTELQGEVSVRLEGVQYQLDAKPRQPFPLAGTAVFHTVEARLKKDWAVQVAKLLGHAAGQSVPNQLQIAETSVVQFHVDENGVHHQGLALLLPQLARGMQIESSGVVGLDEQLDLAFQLRLPQPAVTSAFTSILSKMVSGPMTLYVRGTVSEPKLEAPAGFTLVDQLARNLNPEQDTAEPAPPVGETVMKMIGSAASGDPQAGENLAGGILDIIRAARERRANAEPQDQDAAPEPPRRRPQRARKRL